MKLGVASQTMKKVHFPDRHASRAGCSQAWPFDGEGDGDTAIRLFARGDDAAPADSTASSATATCGGSLELAASPQTCCHSRVHAAVQQLSSPPFVSSPAVCHKCSSSAQPVNHSRRLCSGTLAVQGRTSTRPVHVRACERLPTRPTCSGGPAGGCSRAPSPTTSSSSGEVRAMARTQRPAVHAARAD